MNVLPCTLLELFYDERNHYYVSNAQLFGKFLLNKNKQKKILFWNVIVKGFFWLTQKDLGKIADLYFFILNLVVFKNNFLLM